MPELKNWIGNLYLFTLELIEKVSVFRLCTEAEEL
jgi:hypothetical protein